MLRLVLLLALALPDCLAVQPAACVASSCSLPQQQLTIEPVTNTTIEQIASDSRTQAIILLNREKKKQVKQTNQIVRV